VDLLRIKAGLGSQSLLEVDDDEIRCRDASSGRGQRRILYADVAAVLRTDSLLSIQVGREIVAIPIRWDKADHRAVVARLVSNCKRTQTRVERMAVKR
jgi:hypothetical protein